MCTAGGWCLTWRAAPAPQPAAAAAPAAGTAAAGGAWRAAAGTRSAAASCACSPAGGMDCEPCNSSGSSSGWMHQAIWARRRSSIQGLSMPATSALAQRLQGARDMLLPGCQRPRLLRRLLGGCRCFLLAGWCAPGVLHSCRRAHTTAPQQAVCTRSKVKSGICMGCAVAQADRWRHGGASSSTANCASSSRQCRAVVCAATWLKSGSCPHLGSVTRCEILSLCSAFFCWMSSSTRCRAAGSCCDPWGGGGAPGPRQGKGASL